MRRKILTVEDTFKITGRGLILVGEFDFNSVKIKAGDKILVIKADGEELNLSVKGLEFINRKDKSLPLKELPLLVGNIGKKAVPIGSEIFIEE